MKMKLRWKWNLSKRLSPKIYSYTVYTLTQVQKDKDFQFWQLENLRKEFCPPPLFILRKNPNYLVYSMQAYYFSSESFPASTIIPVTLIILDPRAICILGGGVKSSRRFDSWTSGFKRSDWKSSIKPKAFYRRRLFVYDNKWSKWSS